MSPLPAGTRLGPYEVDSPLGARGMGVYFLTEDLTHSQVLGGVRVVSPVEIAPTALDRVGHRRQDAR